MLMGSTVQTGPLNLVNGTKNGRLLSDLLAFLSADRSACLPFLVPGSVPGEHRAGMGGCSAWHLYAARSDTGLHLSEHGRRKYLVHRAPCRRDPGLLRRQP